MSDRIAAHIALGGALPRSRLSKLLTAIENARVSFEWGDRPLLPTTEEELLQARRKGRIYLCDVEARDGEFPELEQTCRELGLAYTRHTEGKYGYDAIVVDWRPGMRNPLVRRSSNSNDAIYVPLTEVKKALRHLEAGQVRKAKATLHTLCPEVPRLPVFRIVE